MNLKIKLISENKKKSSTWQDFKVAPKNINKSKEEKVEISEENPSASISKPILSEDAAQKEDIIELDSEILANKLEQALIKHSEMSESKIDQSLEIVDELISRNPNVYSSYKAKLILFLTKENLTSNDIDDASINDLLVTMSGFDIISNRNLRREAYLIAKQNKESELLIDEITKLENDLNNINDESMQKYTELEIIDKIQKLEAIENGIRGGLLDNVTFLNDDIVEIPLLRELAKKNYENVIESSEALIDEFPTSIQGYFFLIRALELSGQIDESIKLIQNNQLSTNDLNLLMDRLSRSRDSDAKDYWKNLRF